jgi:hypothetical protein
MIHMNPNVGVAPGTTTMTLGEPGSRTYTVMPKVQTSFQNQDPVGTIYNPYRDLLKLRGLGEATPPRFGLALVAGLMVFVGALYLRRRSRKS